MKKRKKSASSSKYRLNSIESLEDRNMLASDLEFLADVGSFNQTSGQTSSENSHWHAGQFQDDVWQEGFWHEGHTHDNQFNLAGHTHGDEPCTCEMCMQAAAAGEACATIPGDGDLLGQQNHDHQHDGQLRFGPEGNAYFFDRAPTAAELELTAEFDTFGEDAFGEEGDPGFQAVSSVPFLHSNPSATQKIFLDFDGHTTTRNNIWNSFNNDEAIHAPAFSLDGDRSDFNSAELDVIQETFDRVAEDFAAFDVDVTTEDPGISAFTQGGQAIRVVISTDVDDATGNRWFSNAGGVAYLNSWNWTSATPVWTFYNNLGGSAKNIAEASSHEAGHALGLSHDGDNVRTYYQGHGNGSTGWAPIMGVGYSRALTQWSRGEYDNASETQNDINLIRQKLNFRADDFGNDAESASSIVPVGTTSVDIAGIIEQDSDVDYFRIDAFGQTNVDLEFDVIDVGPNLDLQVDVFDSDGSLVTSVNPTNRLDASLSLTLSTGTYTVAVDGVGKGNLSTGYSDYGSLGQYFVTGTVELTDPVAGGASVVSTPTSNSSQLPTAVTIDFDQPIDVSTFSLSDVTAFVDPNGNDVSSLLTGYSFPVADRLQLDFAALDVNGPYSLTIGPEIYDVEGLAMDQNQNGISGEADDAYTFDIEVVADSLPGIGGSAISTTASGEESADFVIITFNQNMDTSSFDIASDLNHFIGPQGNLLASVTGFEWNSLTELQINFSQQTATGDYSLVIGPEILDLEGLALDQNGDGIPGSQVADWYTGTFTIGSTAIPGDFDGNERVDAADVNHLCSEIMAGNNTIGFDLNGDGVVNHDDQDELIFGIIGTLPGDANLDLVVDGSDFNQWNANKFTSVGGWENGDFSCDGSTDGSDFNVWNNFKFQAGPGPQSVVAPTDDMRDLPEAATAAIVFQSSVDTVQPQAAAPFVADAATFTTDSVQEDESADEKKAGVIDSIWADFNAIA